MKAHNEKRLRDFEDGLVRKLEELHGLYVGNVQTIGGLCSQMPTEEPLAENYLCWLSEEVSSLPDMFSGVNENFAIATIEGALVMTEDSVNLDVIRGMAAESGTDVLPTRPDGQRVVWAVSKKWWHSFGYDNVLATIHAKHEEVLTYL
jgi:hypothetical protein